MNRELPSFTVPKETGTYADVLIAVGIADILAELSGTQRTVFLHDKGPQYEISVVPPIGTTEAITMSRLKSGLPVIDLTEARAVLKAKAQKRSQKKNSQPGEVIAEQAVRPDFDLLDNLEALQGTKTYSRLRSALQEYSGPKLTALALRHLFREQEDEDDEGLDEKVSYTQPFSPISGKGVSRPKPSGPGLGGLDYPISWFTEWAKYRGAWICLNAQTIKDTKKKVVGRKFVALAPGKEVRIDVLLALRTDFLTFSRADFREQWASIKRDVLAVIDLAGWLIAHREQGPNPIPGLLLRGKTPAQVIAGVYLAFFRQLGSQRSACALAKLGFVGLPGWFPIHNDADAEHWIATLAEHRDCLSRLDETRQEEALLLSKYRDAISANSLDFYLDFFADYAAHYFRSIDLYLRYRNDGRMFKANDYWRDQFTTRKLEVLIMGLSEQVNPNVGILVKDPAFLALANAVHEATVKAQYWKGRKQQEWDIHYGLAQRWKRAADRGLEFIQELTDFARMYNEENAKRDEKPEKMKFRRDYIVRSDLDHVVDYMTLGKVDSRTLCLLLLAYGFAMTDDERERAQAARDDRQAGRVVADAKP